MSYHPCIKIHPNTNLSGCPDPDAEEAADNIRVSIVRGVHLVELQTKVREDFTITEKAPHTMPGESSTSSVLPKSGTTTTQPHSHGGVRICRSLK